MQYSRNKVHQHHKWLQPKLWIPFHGYPVAQDKQRTQYLLKLKSKWKMLHKYWKFQNRYVHTIGYVYHDTSGQNHGPTWLTQAFLLKEMCMVIFWQDCCGVGNLRKFYWSTVGQKFLTGSAYSCLVQKGGLFLSVYVDDIKLAGKKENNQMWKVLNKQIELGEPTSFLDHVYLGCTQRHRETSKHIVDNYRTMFESKISAGTTGKITMHGNPEYFYMVLRRGRSCQEVRATILRIGEQNYRTTLQSIYSMHWWHQFKEEELNSVRELSEMCTNCSQMSISGTNW